MLNFSEISQKFLHLFSPIDSRTTLMLKSIIPVLGKRFWFLDKVERLGEPQVQALKVSYIRAIVLSIENIYSTASQRSQNVSQRQRLGRLFVDKAPFEVSPSRRKMVVACEIQGRTVPFPTLATYSWDYQPDFFPARSLIRNLLTWKRHANRSQKQKKWRERSPLINTDRDTEQF